MVLPQLRQEVTLSVILQDAGEPSPDKPTGSRIPKNVSYAHPLDGIELENITITDLKVTLLSHELKPEEYWATANYVCGKTRTICRNTGKPSRNI